MFNYNIMRTKDIQVTSNNEGNRITKEFKGTLFTRRDIRKLVKEYCKEFEEYNTVFLLNIKTNNGKWNSSGCFRIDDTPPILTNCRIIKLNDVGWETVDKFRLEILLPIN